MLLPRNLLAHDRSRPRRDSIGYAVAAMSRLAQSDLLDRVGLRRQAEHTVFTVTRGGFRTATTAGRVFARSGRRGAAGRRAATAPVRGVFDLTPTEDEQLLVDVVTELAAEVVRPAAADADVACAAPAEVLAAANEVGLPLLGVPESLGGIAEERAVMAGALVAEALAHGDLGLAVATLAPGAVATAVATWGTDEQQQTYLPAFTGDGPGGVAAAALALTEPRPLFDALEPRTTATRAGGHLVLNGVKSMVPRGAEAELFVVGARLAPEHGEDAGVNVLVIVEAGAEGLSVEADPAMGVRAASLTTLTLDSVHIPESNVLGALDGTTYAECVRLSRIAWCALSVGVGQAVLDYVTPYVKEREAFGEPIARRQSVAFMVANIAIELQAMRLLTWKAASRAAAGESFARDVGLARRLCSDKGMQIGLDGVQLLGGHGFVKEHPVERWYRDLRAISIMEGGVLI
jgi:alkylation response protein AidB-like acyl-CoA dehydrogenase